MLKPLTRQKFEQLIPAVATGRQYRHVWGKIPDFLRRLIFSVVGVAAVWFPLSYVGHGVQLVAGLVAGLYWLWWPAVSASFRNQVYRRYPYSGFWQGEVLSVYVTEELIGKEESVDQRGELVIVEKRERRLNLEIGDETGFETKLQARLSPQHRVIRPGDQAEIIVLSRRANLEDIEKISDIYLPRHRLWVSDYPWLQRDIFEQMSYEFNRRLARHRH
ncbi:hypothetical protein [Synechococcus sp. PCC 6312]|uniref:hypothetical protein n=1 Tax=Synechococcus sp. (strain ATCC 27167 / PCC 6312) TaxID=195253 RepID=UPI00029F44E8|nr:hypothetical protein [Synechococcus sp. PCC 6312]AFY59587.1 hypothetical protein Syn6312_0355 [Synechococcus sp. PCC 6312]